MLRRLRQPENIALIGACLTLVFGLVCCRAVMFWNIELLVQPGVSFIYPPLLIISHSLCGLFIVVAIGLIGISLQSLKSPRHQSSSSFIVLIILLIIGIALILIGALPTSSSSLLACGVLLILVSIVLAVLRLVRYSRFSVAGLIMFVALMLFGIAALYNAMRPMSPPEQTLQLDQGIYHLVSSTYSYEGDGHVTFVVMSCDRVNWLCTSLWVSDTYGGGRVNRNSNPYPATLEFVPPDQLIVHLGNDSFEVPLEPPA